jgi:hypothetical protein
MRDAHGMEKSKEGQVTSDAQTAFNSSLVSQMASADPPHQWLAAVVAGNLNAVRLMCQNRGLARTTAPKKTYHNPTEVGLWELAPIYL